MYEIYYHTLEPYFQNENLQLHYVDTHGMILSMNTKDIIKDLKNSEDIFDFSNLLENHELFSDKSKKVIGIFKIQTPNKDRHVWKETFLGVSFLNLPITFLFLSLNSSWFSSRLLKSNMSSKFFV